MPRSRLRLALFLAFALIAGLGTSARADVPKAGALYETGPSGRYLLGGPWLFRLDSHGRGIREHWQRQRSTADWRTVRVPNAWNVGDNSDASFIGTVGWYRKDFSLPTASAAYKWLVRFESVNYRSEAWLNGVRLGTNAGAYLPFEFRLPGSALTRSGVNHLVVRVDDRRKTTDLPPAGFSMVTHQPVGGWWNYGGLLREVYLRRIDHVDMSTVQVLPSLPCRTCAARILVRAVVHNYDAVAQRVRVAGLYGTTPVDLGTATIAPGGLRVLSAHVTIAQPRLWSPDSPALYHVRLSAEVGPGAGRRAQTWQTESGIRSIRAVDGHLELNYRPLNFRGVGLHEDSLEQGFAIDNATRAKIVAAVKDLGATLIRAHYPLHPELLELADRLGVMVWSEIPMYEEHDASVALASVRAKALQMLTKSILTNSNHPGIVVWSIANELSSKPGPTQGLYISTAVRTAHRLDPTRPVGLAGASNPRGGCQPRYGPLDVIGINEYFSWYPGPDGSSADPTLLSGYLDRVHHCYANKALAVTEVGAEANRHGSADERGTYEFQQAFANWQFGLLDQKTWLSGAVWWALQEFRARPEWDGGNPRPDPPFHQKGLLTLNWEKKPAYFDVQRIFRATQQLGD
jgi:beta-glucuronidase